MSNVEPIKNVDVRLLGENGKYRIAVTVLDASGKGCPSARVEIIDKNGIDRGGEISNLDGSRTFPIEINEAHAAIEVFVGGFIPEKGKKNPWRFDLYGKRLEKPTVQIDPQRVPKGPLSAFFYGLLGEQVRPYEEVGCKIADCRRRKHARHGNTASALRQRFLQLRNITRSIVMRVLEALKVGVNFVGGLVRRMRNERGDS